MYSQADNTVHNQNKPFWAHAHNSGLFRPTTPKPDGSDFCLRCHAKFPYTDQHVVCNLCLSPDHQEEDCEACQSFRSKKTVRDRRARRLEMASKNTEYIDTVEEEQA
ncbi:hypothetical protein NDU88_003898 [Pleurodeles waltl]|uniref:Uncharacterized protein n=1 Tax=Pleurodeles waltl TaxID=8319 RepID=A0AAV7M4T5_PLEWA|nr:hypothetical protein NDU88_003898 [Pleurodeles waltl]